LAYTASFVVFIVWHNVRKARIWIKSNILKCPISIYILFTSKTKNKPNVAEKLA